LEMQRQKTANAELLKSHQSLEKQVTALSAALSSSSQDSDHRAQLEKALEATQARLTRLESALSSGTPSTSSDAASPSSPGGIPRKSAKPTGWDW
jgi:ferritin-like metal-binding protein YciE